MRSFNDTRSRSVNTSPFSRPKFPTRRVCSSGPSGVETRFPLAEKNPSPSTSAAAPAENGEVPLIKTNYHLVPDMSTPCSPRKQTNTGKVSRPSKYFPRPQHSMKKHLNSGESSDDVIVLASSSENSEFEFTAPLPRLQAEVKKNLGLSNAVESEAANYSLSADEGAVSWSNPARSLSITRASLADGSLSVASLPEVTAEDWDEQVLITHEESPIVIREIKEEEDLDEEEEEGLVEAHVSERADAVRDGSVMRDRDEENPEISMQTTESHAKPAASANEEPVDLRNEDAPEISMETVNSHEMSDAPVDLISEDAPLISGEVIGEKVETVCDDVIDFESELTTEMETKGDILSSTTGGISEAVEEDDPAISTSPSHGSHGNELIEAPLSDTLDKVAMETAAVGSPSCQHEESPAIEEENEIKEENFAVASTEQNMATDPPSGSEDNSVASKCTLTSDDATNTLPEEASPEHIEREVSTPLSEGPTLGGVALLSKMESEQRHTEGVASSIDDVSGEGGCPPISSMDPTPGERPPISSTEQTSSEGVAPPVSPSDGRTPVEKDHPSISSPHEKPVQGETISITSTDWGPIEGEGRPISPVDERPLDGESVFTELESGGNKDLSTSSFDEAPVEGEVPSISSAQPVGCEAPSTSDASEGSVKGESAGISSTVHDPSEGSEKEKSTTSTDEEIDEVSSLPEGDASQNSLDVIIGPPEDFSVGDVGLDFVDCENYAGLGSPHGEVPADYSNDQDQTIPKRETLYLSFDESSVLASTSDDKTSRPQGDTPLIYGSHDNCSTPIPLEREASKVATVDQVSPVKQVPEGDDPLISVGNESCPSFPPPMESAVLTLNVNGVAELQEDAPLIYVDNENGPCSLQPLSEEEDTVQASSLCGSAPSQLRREGGVSTSNESNSQSEEDIHQIGDGDKSSPSPTPLERDASNIHADELLSPLQQLPEGDDPLITEIELNDCAIFSPTFEFEDTDSDSNSDVEVTCTEPCTETTSIGSASEDDVKGQRSRRFHGDRCGPNTRTISQSSSSSSLLSSSNRFDPPVRHDDGDPTNEGGPNSVENDSSSCGPSMEVRRENNIFLARETPDRSIRGISQSLSPVTDASLTQVSSTDCSSVLPNQWEALVCEGVNGVPALSLFILCRRCDVVKEKFVEREWRPFLVAYG